MVYRRLSRPVEIAAISVLLFTVPAFRAAARPREVLEGGLFEITYEEGQEPLAERTLNVLQKALDEFAARLPAGDTPIKVIVCSDIQTFYARARRLAKLRVDGVAQARQSLIIVKAPPLRNQPFDYSGTLRHELVHVLLARNTNTDLLPRWLNEGIAMHVAKDFRWESMLRLARMYMQGRVIDYPMLNFTFFAPASGRQFGDAYAQSLSMTRFLIDYVGEDTFWEIVYAVRDMTFKDALKRKAGITPAEFYDAWVRSLWKVALIASLVSGFSVFPFGALLLLLAFWRRRQRNREVLQKWACEEAMQDNVMLPWELEGREPEYSWENFDDEDMNK